jgi:catechol 2,3-dioxygenase-like lactoylglutathione lyase family enzyme
MEAIDHLDLVVSDLERSLEFYAGLLRPLGYVRRSEITGEQGERVVYLERPGGYGQVSVRQRRSRPDEERYDRYALGLHHLAFAAPDRDTVDAIARWLHDGGHEIESGPQEHEYGPGYYAVFFYDPDGIKLEIVHWYRDEDLAQRVLELEARLARLEGGGDRPAE